MNEAKVSPQPALGGNAVRHALAAGTLAARAAAGTLGFQLVAMLLGGALPVTVAWFTKLVLDELADGAAMATLIALAAGLAGAGAVAAAVPHLTGYLRAELERRAGVLAQDRLFAAVDTFAGLARFENPRFLDRLRLARQAGGQTPGQVDHSRVPSRAAAKVG